MSTNSSQIFLVPIPRGDEVDVVAPITPVWEKVYDLHVAMKREYDGHTDFIRKDAEELRKLLAIPGRDDHDNRSYLVVLDGEVQPHGGSSQVQGEEARLQGESWTVSEADLSFNAVDPDAIVGRLDVERGLETNLKSMYAFIVLLEEFRRRGIGSAVLEWVREKAAADGRTILDAWSSSPLRDGGERIFPAKEGGSIPADWPASAFLAAQGFGLEIVEKVSVLDLTDPDLEGINSAMLDRAWERAGSDYRIEEIGELDPDTVDQHYVDALNAFDADVPSADSYEPPVETLEQVRQTIEKYAKSGICVSEIRLWHEPSGRLIGFSELSFYPHQKRASQQATWVHKDHRGKGLAALMKATNIARMMREYPQVNAIETENAEENASMWAINEKVGFKVCAAQANWNSYYDGKNWGPKKPESES